MEPCLNKKRELSEFEFFELFSDLDRHEQYEVIEIMIRHGIEYVDEKDEETKQLENVQVLSSKREDKDYKRLMSLTNEELCVIFQQGETAALAALLEKNKRFVYQLALKINREYRAPSLTIDDLYMEGNLGLIEAANRFEVSKGYLFSTYSWHWIRQKIVRAAMDTGYVIRIPVHLFEEITKINNCRRRHLDASMSDLVELLEQENNIKISKEQIGKLIRISDMYMNISSLNNIVGEDGDSELQDFYADDSPSVEETVEANILREDLEVALSSMKLRERQVLEFRFGLNGGHPKTLEEVGTIFNLTRERIRQIEGKALRKLRHPSRSKKLKDYLEE